MSKSPQQVRNADFIDQLRESFRRRRFTIPEELAHRKNEGRELRDPTPRTTGHRLSRRAALASRVLFSPELRLRATTRQLKVWALQVADQLKKRGFN